MIFQKHRSQIWNQQQHPYKHNLTEFPYLNESLPPGNVVNVEQALNWIIGVIYPQTQPSVATPGALPLAGNTINDYRVVNDDGDGKAAGYRWMQLEGDVAPQWYKIYDMDWGEDSILSNFLLKTQDVYVYRYGIDDLDETGTPYAGDLAGQRIYGGESAGSHLTLFSNSGDGVGAGTGFIQFGDDVRPLFDSDVSLGTDTYRFLNFYTDEANVSTMQITSGSITDTTGGIDFDDENLSTDGTGSFGTLLLAGGSITDGSGLVDFDDEDLITSGVVTANSVTATGAASTFASGTTVGTLTLADGSITDSTGAISFGDENLSSTGSGTFGQLTVDNIQIDGNLISSSAGDIDLTPTGDFNVTGDTFLIGNLDLTGSITLGPADNVVLDSTGMAAIAAFAFTTAAGGFSFAPTNLEVDFTANLDPTADATYDLGEAAQRWNDLFLEGDISDGTLAMAMTTLVTLRDINVGVGVGFGLFWDGSKWVASLPDSEIDHGTVSGLLDDDHSQYMLLAGRPAGQFLNGGNDAFADLNFDSTSHASKGRINFYSTLSPNITNNVDIGTSGFRFRNLYTTGQAIGFRVENVAALPASSPSNTGRLVWLNGITLYVDDGTAWQEIGSDKYVSDDAVTWDGTNVTQTYTTSSQISDARRATWQFLDNTNGFRNVQGATITKTMTQVTVTFTVPPASGTYRLVGVG